MFFVALVDGVVMRAFEDLLVPGSTDLPECHCGTEMHLFGTKPALDAEIRIFRCEACNHEFQLVAWKAAEKLA
jgi:hypothetical protein